MLWIDDPALYEQRAWQCQRIVRQALERLREQHEIDREGVLLAGEGAGARAALDVAARSPGIYRGLLLVDPALDASLPVPRLDNLATFGVPVVALHDRSLDGPARDLESWFQSAGLLGVRAAEAAEIDPGRLAAILRELIEDRP
jgi:pimeloyl-ACP methyl ester carboxylesterase